LYKTGIIQYETFCMQYVQLVKPDW